jgi:transposase
MSQSRWLVGGLVAGLSREPEKGLAREAEGLLKLLHRWRDEAVKAGRRINRVCIAYEAGRDGFCLALWLRARDIECHVIHPASAFRRFREDRHSPSSPHPAPSPAHRVWRNTRRFSTLGWLRSAHW